MSERIAVGSRSVAIGPWHRASGTPPDPPHRPPAMWTGEPMTIYPIWADAGHTTALGATDHDGCWALTTEGITDEAIEAALLDFDQGGHVDAERIERTRRLLLDVTGHWTARREHGEG